MNFFFKVTRNCCASTLKAHNEIQFVVPQNSMMVSTLQAFRITFNVATIADVQCCRCLMLQLDFQ